MLVLVDRDKPKPTPIRSVSIRRPVLSGNYEIKLIPDFSDGTEHVFVCTAERACDRWVIRANVNDIIDTGIAYLAYALQHCQVNKHDFLQRVGEACFDE